MLPGCLPVHKGYSSCILRPWSYFVRTVDPRSYHIISLNFIDCTALYCTVLYVAPTYLLTYHSIITSSPPPPVPWTVTAASYCIRLSTPRRTSGCLARPGLCSGLVHARFVPAHTHGAREPKSHDPFSYCSAQKTERPSRALGRERLDAGLASPEIRSAVSLELSYPPTRQPAPHHRKAL